MVKVREEMGLSSANAPVSAPSGVHIHIHIHIKFKRRVKNSKSKQ